LPSDHTLKNGSYPIIQPFFFYWDGGARSPMVQRFIDFCKEKSAQSL
jgi:hypothetical protein